MLAGRELECCRVPGHEPPSNVTCAYHWFLFRLSLSSFHLPYSQISLVPDVGLQVSISNAFAELDGNWRIKMNLMCVPDSPTPCPGSGQVSSPLPSPGVSGSSGFALSRVCPAAAVFLTGARSLQWQEPSELPRQWLCCLPSVWGHNVKPSPLLWHLGCEGWSLLPACTGGTFPSTCRDRGWAKVGATYPGTGIENCPFLFLSLQPGLWFL